MATTSQLLNWIELECHGWTRNGVRGTLNLFNEAHRLLLTGEREQFLVYDDATGDFPYITTVAGTYKYTAPTDTWRVKHILVDVDSSMGYNQSLVYDWQLEDVNVGGQDYYRVRNVTSKDGTDSTNASYLFRKQDPGDTTSIYRICAYRKPIDITSDSIEHEMPGTSDIEALMPATMKLIDAINDHGKSLEARQYILQVLRPIVWKELDGGEQSSNSFCVRRAF